MVGDNQKEWWVDTGATRHICANNWMFTTYKAVTGEHCYKGNFATFKVESPWTITLKMTSGKELTVTNVFYVLEIRKNLISGLVLNKKGFRLVFLK